MCKDGDAAFPITTTIAPKVGCPVSNDDLTLVSLPPTPPHTHWPAHPHTVAPHTLYTHLYNV
jgi:hypothetical protein